MKPERDNYQALLESLADGVEVDWAALDAAATTDAERRRNRNLRLVARVAELHRTLVLDDEDAAASANALTDIADDPATWGHLSVRAADCRRRLRRHLSRARSAPQSRGRAQAAARRHLGGPADRPLGEARTLARVRHPNVVTVHGADVRDGRAGLWMEFVDGQTLESWLRANGAHGRGEATAVSIDLCRALAAVHGAGLVHGDVKAQNVMREAGRPDRPHGFRRRPRAGRGRDRRSRARRSTSRRRCWRASRRRRGATSTVSASCSFTC